MVATLERDFGTNLDWQDQRSNYVLPSACLCFSRTFSTAGLSGLYGAIFLLT